MIASDDIRRLAAVALEAACTTKTCPVYFQTLSAPYRCPFGHLKPGEGVLPCVRVTMEDWLRFFEEGSLR